MMDRYTYRVMWSEEDEEYVGLCAEFSLLSHLDDTPEKAFSGIRDLVAFCVDDLRKQGAPVPEPLPLGATAARSRFVFRPSPTVLLPWMPRKPASA